MSDDPPADEPSSRSRRPTGAAIREEWRTEQEAATEDAAEQWRHSRTLLDLTRSPTRIDRMAITVAGHRVVGEIIEVARVDRIALLNSACPAHAAGRRAGRRLGAARVRVVESARAGGRSGAHARRSGPGCSSSKLRGGPVVVATVVDAEVLVGALTVGTDLVVIATTLGVETVVALSAVATVSLAG